jgi:hypothetical protein
MSKHNGKMMIILHFTHTSGIFYEKDEVEMTSADNRVFEGYHYRTSSRFGSRVKIEIVNDSISITGPRIGPVIYRTWILIQSILLFLMIPAVIFPLVLGKPVYLLLVIGLLFLHYAISGTGAIILWEGANVMAFTDGKAGDTEIISMGDIKDIRMGKGWERKGLWLVIPYVIPIINKVTEGLCISFEAPDSVTGKDVVYAFLLHSREETYRLEGLLNKNIKE